MAPCHDGDWSLIPAKEAFNLCDGSTLGTGFPGEAAFKVWRSGKIWYVLNLRTEEEVGPFDDVEVAKTEAKSLAESEGFQVVTSWPWGVEDVTNHPVRPG